MELAEMGPAQDYAIADGDLCLWAEQANAWENLPYTGILFPDECLLGNLAFFTETYYVQHSKILLKLVRPRPMQSASQKISAFSLVVC